MSTVQSSIEHRRVSLSAPVADRDVIESMKPATPLLERVALKLRELADRRRQHVYDLYRSGRWRHYYTDREFIEVMRLALNDDEWLAALAEDSSARHSPLPPAA
jgi:hypothetical protein